MSEITKEDAYLRFNKELMKTVRVVAAVIKTVNENDEPGREKLEDARAHLGCEGPKFGIRAQGVHDVFAQASELESSSDESPEGLGAFGLHPGAKLREEFRSPAASDRVESIHGLLSCPIPDACAGRAARRGSSGRR